MDDKRCGTCKYHVHEEIDDAYVCVNDQSGYLAEWTDESDSCGDWEARDDGN